VELYLKTRITESGLQLYRCSRGSSDTEGWHLYYKLARLATAKKALPAYHNPRDLVLTHAWNVRALVTANLLVDLATWRTWMMDEIYNLFQARNKRLGELPDAFKSTSAYYVNAICDGVPVIPRMFVGTNTQLLGYSNQQWLSPLTSKEDRDLVTSTAAMKKAVLNFDPLLLAKVCTHTNACVHN
jgi:hypothetical protein